MVQIEYVSIVYNSAVNTRPLDTIANEALRIATGVNRQTTVDSLYILANEFSLKLRREKAIFRYHYKIRSNIDSPAF